MTFESGCGFCTDALSLVVERLAALVAFSNPRKTHTATK
jgi:hypothetical protein